MSYSDPMALLALLLSAVSALIALRSTQVADRAYRLAARQAERFESGLSLELISYEAARAPDGRQRLFAFRVAVTNNSDVNTSLKTLELILVCARRGGPESHYHLTPDVAITFPGLVEADRLTPPAVLGGRATITGVAVFQLPTELLQRSEIESYTVRAADSLGAVAEREALFVNERH
jgi:hypothetical protein